MSNQSNNPFQQPTQRANNPYTNPQGPQSQQPQQPLNQGYAPPPGPPPRRTETFKAEDFVPASELSEQREAMEQFEMNQESRGGPGMGSQQDRDLATLQSEFPGIDGTVIAAIYGDSGNMGATREVLGELASSGGAAGGS